MPKILHTARYTGIPLGILHQACPDGFLVKTLDVLSYDQLLKEAVDADYLLVSGRLPIDKGVLDAASHLKMIQRTGVGTEMLDLDAIKKRGIPVYVNAGVNAQSVAEHTMALILACLKRLPVVNKQTHEGVWKKQQVGVSTNELCGKKVGLVGMGRIGLLVAAMLRPFGTSVLYTDVVRQPSDVEEKYGLTFCPTFREMLPDLDILSFHCPLTPENTEVLNADTLSLMKEGAIVINTARGKLINPDDLYQAVVSGRIKAAGLDTHFEEPFTLDDYKLTTLDNVILTPHIAGLSYEAFLAMMVGAMENIRLFEEGSFVKIESKKII